MTQNNHPLVFYTKEENSEIIFAQFPNAVVVDLVLAKELVAIRLSMMKDKKHYLVIDLSNVRKVSAEAKEFLQRPDKGLKNILGAAFIATNPVSAMIANVFVKTPKDFQARSFTTKAEAFRWMHEQSSKVNGSVNT